MAHLTRAFRPRAVARAIVLSVGVVAGSVVFLAACAFVDTGTHADVDAVPAKDIPTPETPANIVFLIGDGMGVTTITPTASTATSGDARGWWLVDSGFELNLSHVTLDGSGYLIWQAIRHKGTGLIDHVRFNAGPFYALSHDHATNGGRVHVSKRTSKCPNSRATCGNNNHILHTSTSI